MSMSGCCVSSGGPRRWRHQRRKRRAASHAALRTTGELCTRAALLETARCGPTGRCGQAELVSKVTLLDTGELYEYARTRFFKQLPLLYITCACYDAAGGLRCCIDRPGLGANALACKPRPRRAQTSPNTLKRSQRYHHTILDAL